MVTLLENNNEEKFNKFIDHVYKVMNLNSDILVKF